MNNKEKLNGFHPSILCAIDFTEASQQALEWAVREARQLSTRLMVLYPYRLNQLQGKEDLGSARKGIDAEAVLNFEKIARSTLDKAQVPYDFKPEVGFLNDRIYSHSHKKEFAMLVISKRMASDNMESISELIELIKFPLVIVPQSKP